MAFAQDAHAQPLAINQGGTGNTWGLPSQYAVINNTATGTTFNTLTKYVYSYGPFATKAQVAATTDTAIVGVCVANCAGSGVHASATIQTGGYADCIFDGTTTVGDFVQISTGSTTAGDCTDAGATAPTSGQVIGQVMTANSGAGTTSMVQLSLTPSTVDTCVSCKCVADAPVTCPTSATPPTWKTVCSCNLGPFAHDPGQGNTWISIDQNIIDFTDGTPAASAIDFELTTTCPMSPNSDPHGLPAAYYSAGTRYPNNTMVGMLNYSTADPLYPNPCSVSIKCAAGGTGTGTFTINPAALDSNGIPAGTAFLLKACVFDNR